MAGLGCFHCIDTVSALTLVADLHEPRPFPSGRRLAAYLGLVPRELAGHHWHALRATTPAQG